MYGYITYLFVLFLDIFFVTILSKQMIWVLILYLKELMVNQLKNFSLEKINTRWQFGVTHKCKYEYCDVTGLMSGDTVWYSVKYKSFLN